MRLRQLKFPIAILQRNSLIGGKNANLHLPRRFDHNVPSYYRKGGFDEALIYDSEGREFSVCSIELYRMSAFSRFLQFIGWLVKGSEDLVNVDMVLDYRRTLSFEDFRSEMMRVALAHPKWWTRHSELSEIENMFSDCKTVAEAIDSIGVLDAPGQDYTPGKSKKIIDMTGKKVRE